MKEAATLRRGARDRGPCLSQNGRLGLRVEGPFSWAELFGILLLIKNACIVGYHIVKWLGCRWALRSEIKDASRALKLLTRKAL